MNLISAFAKTLNALAFGSFVFAFASNAKASPTIYASNTNEKFASGVNWQDSMVDTVWNADHGSFIAGIYQRNRDATGQETGYKVGYEVQGDSLRTYRLTYVNTPNAITLADWGLAGGVVQRINTNARAEFDLGTRQWRGYSLYESRVAYYQTLGNTELAAGLRVSSAEGALAKVPFVGVAHDMGRLNLGGQVFAGQAITDHTVSAVNSTFHTKGGQFTVGYQLTDRAWLRAIFARSYETLGWKSSNAIVLAYDFN